MKLALCVLAGFVFVVFVSAFATARPGGGKSFGGASASASAPNPYLTKTRKDKAPKEEPASEAWSQRPGYAAPWTVPSAVPSGPKTRAAGMAPPAKPESRGSAFAYFFWLAVGGFMVATALFAARFMKERAQKEWATSPTTAPPRPAEVPEPEQADDGAT